MNKDLYTFHYWCEGRLMRKRWDHENSLIQVACGETQAHEVCLIVKDCPACGGNHRFELPVKSVLVLS